MLGTCVKNIAKTLNFLLSLPIMSITHNCKITIETVLHITQS